MRWWCCRRENPKNKRGANDYGVAQSGLDGEERTELFADYTARFAIPREHEGSPESEE